MYQIDQGCRRLLWIGKDRTTKTLLRFFRMIGKERTAALQFVCSDMWQPYLKVTERDLSDYDLVALFLDGKTFGDDQMVIGLGVTVEGGKVVLGFVQTATENERTCSAFLRGLLDRGLKIDAGLLCVIDGAKGLRKAVDKVFGDKAAVQRCQWHKRENVVGYLPTSKQATFRQKLQRAYDRFFSQNRGSADNISQRAAGPNRISRWSRTTYDHIAVLVPRTARQRSPHLTPHRFQAALLAVKPLQVRSDRAFCGPIASVCGP